MDPLELNAVVALRQDITPWLAIFHVVPDGWDVPEFVAGQYTSLGLPGSVARCPVSEPEPEPARPDKMIRRAYSIASSANNREFLEFFISLVGKGVFTPRLFSLTAGQRIWMGKKCVGKFTFAGVPDDANLVLIATGTGLAPYLSMLTSHHDAAKRRRVAVVQGVRTSADLGYRSQMMALPMLNPNISFFPIVSRPQLEPFKWTGLTGHVQPFWKSGAIACAWGFPPAADNTHVYLCGNPQMTEQMTALLAAEGFRPRTKTDPGNIHVENYWEVDTDATAG